VEVVAFHDGIHNSRGTRDCVQRALKVGLKVTLVTRQRSHQITTEYFA